jgi:hypothetical protein
MITQIIWLACLPVTIFVSYKLVAYTIAKLEKKHPH